MARETENGGGLRPEEENSAGPRPLYQPARTTDEGYDPFDNVRLDFGAYVTTFRADDTGPGTMGDIHRRLLPILAAIVLFERELGRIKNS